MDTYQLTVENMSCSNCEDKIQTAASQVDGVYRVEPDHESNIVKVTADPDTESAVRQQIHEAGYDIAV